jgi:hypothetical protein
MATMRPLGTARLQQFRTIDLKGANQPAPFLSHVPWLVVSSISTASPQGRFSGFVSVHTSLLRNRPQAEKTRRVESAGLSSDRSVSFGPSAIGKKAIPGSLTNPHPPRVSPSRGAYTHFEAFRVEYRARHFRWNFAPAPSIRRCPQCWGSGVSETRWRRPPSARASTETTPSFANAIRCFASAGRASFSEIAPNRLGR